jgi:hypothetical protein
VEAAAHSSRWHIRVAFGLRTQWTPNIGVNSRSSLRRTPGINAGVRRCKTREGS